MNESKIIEMCNSLDTRTFSAILPTLKELLLSESTKPLIRLHIGDFFYRKIYYYYKPRGEDRDAFLKAVIDSISRVNNVVGKSSYLRYTDTEAIRAICLHFYKNRFPEVYFLLQMINDQTLINIYDVTEMEQHFVAWIQEENLTFEQKSNLLDVLIRHFPRNKKLQEIRDELSGGKVGVISIYENKQNAHDENLTERTIEKAYLLFEDTVQYFREDLRIDTYLPKVLREWYPRADQEATLDTVLTRVNIDHTIFGDSAIRTFTISNLLLSVILYIENAGDARDLLGERLWEEFEDMKNLCATGYVLRLMNVFRGIDEKYAANINFEDQLHARLTTLISNLFIKEKNIPEAVIYGTYDEKYKPDYQAYVLKYISRQITSIYADYDKDEVDSYMPKVLERLFEEKIPTEILEDYGFL
jgi:hypothetical protein